jgi:putative two-component system response regulator
LAQTRPELIVSDVVMPGCDGFSLLEAVHARPEWVTIPFLFLTALDDQESLARGRALGVDDYLTKPFSPAALAQSVGARLERASALQSAYKQEAYLRTILVVVRAIESRDTYTGGHVERVSAYAEALARRLGWPEIDIHWLRLSAILHDVGKVMVPDAILNKIGRLSPEEHQVMQAHPETGAHILAPLGDLPLVLDGVRHHHECYDGQGYPDGLAGDSIPVIGRLLAVVDAFDAMITNRPYRPRLAVPEALSRLQAGAGSQFDPAMVEAFVLEVVENGITNG